MSGTSLDGIDVAVVEIRGKRIEPVGFRCFPYPKNIRAVLLNIQTVAEVSRLNFQLGELYAQAILATVKGKRPELIGLHGQTVYHEGGNTLQIGEAAVVAERTGIPVISNFRERDIAAGGQGAPLVPFVDYRLFRHRSRTRVALNIGGIANITVIPAGADPGDVIAFDTGPGNMLIDALAPPFDRGGRIARSGVVQADLLAKLLRNAYFSRKPPKSAGREQFGQALAAELLAAKRPLKDLVATVTELTAQSIADAIRPFTPREVIASGGGVHNRTLMDRLAALLPAVTIHTTGAFGVDPDAKEAIAFAVLAYESMRRRPANLPSATGARRPVILGKLTRT